MAVRMLLEARWKSVTRRPIRVLGPMEGWEACWTPICTEPSSGAKATAATIALADKRIGSADCPVWSLVQQSAPCGKPRQERQGRVMAPDAAGSKSAVKLPLTSELAADPFTPRTVLAM